jgi:hypothetical protein
VRKLLVFLGTAVALLWAAAPAHADNASDAVAGFNNGSSHVYNAPGSGFKVDTDAVNSAINNRPIYFSLFGEGAGDAKALAVSIGEQVEAKSGERPVSVVLVKNGTHGDLEAVSQVLDSDQLAALAATVPGSHASQLATGDATDTLTAFVDGLSSVGQRSSSGGSSSAAGSASGEKKSSHAGVILLVVLLLLAVGLGAFLMTRRRKKQRELADLRAGVVSLYDRLGADVSNIDPKDNDKARQALADASERYTATGSQLAQADSKAKYEVARRTALEGLYAARGAREELGLPLGAELPTLHPSTGDGLNSPTTIKVQGQDVRGYPDYQPGAPHYYGGGGGYAAGWYSMPFWETLLLTSALSGGFGGGWGWGGGGGGFDSGYRDGYQDAQQDNSNQGDSGGGGDWGGGGGGDWGGGGGGDWGGGGGDWGGGGGDWGGGGDGGGGSW